MAGELVTAIVVGLIGYYLHVQTRKSWALNFYNNSKELFHQLQTHSLRMSIIYSKQLDELRKIGVISEETLEESVEGWDIVSKDIEEMSKLFDNLAEMM